jgi:hypothetical protein
LQQAVQSTRQEGTSIVGADDSGDLRHSEGGLPKKRCSEADCSAWRAPVRLLWATRPGRSTHLTSCGRRHRVICGTEGQRSQAIIP